jgi:hypothetical protein
LRKRADVDFAWSMPRSGKHSAVTNVSSGLQTPLT